VTDQDVFTLEELVLLNTYATPIERAFLLLGINCGFGRAEIGSLLVGEVFVRQPHEQPFRDALKYPFSSEDSFIKRVRRKTGVYGEHVLFRQTVEAVERALRRRRRMPGFGPSVRLLLNDRGQAYDQPSTGGNPNQQIPNRFSDLVRRVRAKGEDIRRLSFGKLRKTAGNLIRQFADGEVAGVFLCHGQPVATDNLLDVYTGRPFGRVFQAIREVEKYLEPMFLAAGATPFGDRRPRAVSGD
jgi:hypothetical protein